MVERRDDDAYARLIAPPRCPARNVPLAIRLGPVRRGIPSMRRMLLSKNQAQIMPVSPVPPRRQIQRAQDQCLGSDKITSLVANHAQHMQRIGLVGEDLQSSAVKTLGLVVAATLLVRERLLHQVRASLLPKAFRFRCADLGDSSMTLLEA